jgi:hypothetical protein
MFSRYFAEEPFDKEINTSFSRYLSIWGMMQWLMEKYSGNHSKLADIRRLTLAWPNRA